MKKIVIFLLLVACGFSYAQTYRFIYELKINKDDDIEKINMILDIDKNTVKFYDEEFLSVDSIRKITGENRQTNSESDQLLIRKINSSDNKTFRTHSSDYFLITSMDKMNWKLEKETKNIENIKLQKATTNFGGRKWTAWFNAEIPIQEGPYKFNGLSGLIFEVYDSENIFHYNLVQSTKLPNTFNTSNFLETHYGKKPITVTLKQYQKVKLDYYNNIVEVLNEFAKKGGTIASDQNLSSPEEIAKKRKFLQESIKKYYLPIEKDKAIPYPNN